MVAEKIGVHHPPKLSLRHILQRSSGRHAGVVYDGASRLLPVRDNIDPTAALDRGVAEDIELLDVDAIFARPPLSVPARVTSLLHVRHRGEDAPAPRCQNDRCRLSNSGRCSGN